MRPRICRDFIVALHIHGRPELLAQDLIRLVLAQENIGPPQERFNEISIAWSAVYKRKSVTRANSTGLKFACNPSLLNCIVTYRLL
jgi:hypothetical protein